jgi:hypothetical protein
MTSSAAALDLYTPGYNSSAVYEFDPLNDSRWEGLVHSHPRASLFHSAKWLRALHSAYGYEPVVLTTCPPKAPLTNGLVFCRVRSWLTGQRLVSLPFSDHCEPLASNGTELDDLLNHARHKVEDGGWKYVEIRPTFSSPSESTGFGPSNTYWLHRLNLDPSLEVLFRAFHKSCIQRKIRRAEREGLVYEQGSSERLLEKFYKLLVITRKRLFLPPQPRYWFRALVASFGGDLAIRVASKNDEPVASILTISNRGSIFYKYGCSDARFNRLGGMQLVFWNTIQEAKAQNLRELEMGRSDQDGLGLIAFKEHWGAVGTRLTYWRYPNLCSASRAEGWQKAVLRPIIPVMPNSALPAVGRLLYRHIG